MNMRHLLIISITLFFSSCNRYQTSDPEIENFVDNQLENNRIEINRIKREIKEFKIEKNKKNIVLMNNLDQLHEYVLALTDSIDSQDKNMMLIRTIDFIELNFRGLDSFTEVPFKISENTPRSIMKLRVATLEAFWIRMKRTRYDFTPEGGFVPFNKIEVQIKPSKLIVNRSEKITGEVFLSAVAVYERPPFPKVIINGQEIPTDNGTWKFEIDPKVKGTGLVPYELNCEIVPPDGTNTFKGQHLIYVKN